MSRSPAGWACALTLLSLSGCATGGGRRPEAMPRLAAIPERPARPSGWLGGRLARPSRAHPRTEPTPAALASAGSASESSLARYFPGLPRSSGSGHDTPGVQPSARPAPMLAGAPSPAPRLPVPARFDDVPMLPVALNVEIHPDAAGARTATLAAPGEMPPLIEAGPESSDPEPEPLIKVGAEAPALEPEPVVEARAEEAEAEAENEPSPAPKPDLRAAATEPPPRETDVLGDAAPAPASRLESAPSAEPAGRPRLTRRRSVPPPPISRAEQANLLFPRSYYEPGELAPNGPSPEAPPAPATPQPPSRLRRWFGRQAAPTPPASSSLKPGDIAQGR